MSKEKLDESIILETIQTSETNFDVSANGLIQLKKGGVKKRVIEAMMRASRNKNTTSPNSSSTGTVTGTQKIQETQQLPAPAPTTPPPTPKPTPIATQDSEFFSIDLYKCEISGSSIACFFTLTNNGPDRRINIDYRNSNLVDYSGNTANYDGYKLGAAHGQWGGAWTSEGVEMLQNAYITGAWIRFSGADPALQKIGRLTIGFEIINLKRFSFQFRDIPITKSTRQSNPTVTGTFDEKIPETDAERRRREQREAELKKGVQREVKKIIDSILKP